MSSSLVRIRPEIDCHSGKACLNAQDYKNICLILKQVKKIKPVCFHHDAVKELKKMTGLSMSIYLQKKEYP